MKTVKFATFETVTERHHNIDYDTIVGIYNKNTGVFDSVEKDNINVIITNNNLMNSKVIVNSDKKIMTVGFDTYNRVSEIINKSKYSYEFILEIENTLTIDKLIFDYMDDLKVIDDLKNTYDKLVLSQHKVDVGGLKEKTYNFVASKIEELLDYEYSLFDAGININISSFHTQSYIPNGDDIRNIYNILVANKDSFDELRILKQCVQRKIIAFEQKFIDGGYETVVSKNVKVTFDDVERREYILNLLKELQHFIPDVTNIKFNVYNKHISIKFCDVAYNWINNNKTSEFIRDINNILSGKN